MFACSEDAMDDVNEEKNDALEMDAKNLIPDAIVKSAYETTGTDMAWYTSVYIEHNAGTWGQAYDEDHRKTSNSSQTLNNSWNELYDVMNICHTIILKTDPTTGTEKENYWCRGVAQILMAYNLSVATDMWGEIPYDEAFMGMANLKPKYQNQSEIYPIVQGLLDDGIANMTLATSDSKYADKDLIYGGDRASWIKAAYSLKARYYLRLSNRNANAATNALTALANGFTSMDEEMLFTGYVDDLPNANPWGEYWYSRDHNSISVNFYNILDSRNDPRIPWLVLDGSMGPAPSGESQQSQGGYYQSALSCQGYGWTAPTPLITYHELLFIETEAKFRTGDATWTTSLQNAIAAAFAYIGDRYWGESVGDPAAYYTAEVAPRLTAGNELNEIMTQKYIAMFEAQSMEAYNDYRRTGIPTMTNPFNSNTNYGFVNRFPYAYSEVSNNPANVPSINVFTSKVWWAGGSELVK
ncbi:hypothetical protein CYCD_21080 [Tenuifilaceae bacterium CYCD]|nr:hypothetical protein CYCD_21080 [Tenuifilaceae bacterium CYCD]